MIDVMKAYAKGSGESALLVLMEEKLRPCELRGVQH